jgi:membrane fusion protein, heavy metal efflux system
MKRTLIMLLFWNLLSEMAVSQEFIVLDQAERQRLGLVTTSLTSPDGSRGSSFPATVVNAPDSAASLLARHDGIVESWLQTPGDSISRGQPLVILRSQDVLVLQQHWMSSVLALEEADFVLQKDQALFAEGVIAQQRLVQTRRQHAQAAQQERSAREILLLAGHTATGLEALRQQGEGLGLYPVTAPVDGKLTSRMVNAGEQVVSHAVLGSISSGDPWLQVEVPASLVPGLTEGQSLFTADLDEPLVLRQISRQVDSSRQTVMLLAAFTTRVNYLPGQVIRVMVAPVSQGVVVPAAAVVHSGLETTVYVINDQGVEARVLSLLPLGADFLAVQGLQPGEEVVVRGTSLLKGIQLGLGGEE